MAKNNRKNYKYGKIVDGDLLYAPYYLEHSGSTTVNGTAEMYLEYGGWKFINAAEYQQKEDETVQYGAAYEEDETTIYVTWEVIQAEEMEV